MKYFVILLTLFLLATSQVEAAELSGQASYYSRAGCLGCSASFLMKNGDVLDDKKMTIALTPYDLATYKLMNKYVGVINRLNHKWVIAKVTDTGGFARYDRVADLGLAVKIALDCSSLCDVIIIY